MRLWTTCLGAMLMASAVLTGQDAGPAGLAALLDRVGARVEQYYSRARSVLCTETVRLQPLGFDWAPRDRGRQIVYDLRVQWDPASDGEAPEGATVLRQIVSVNGHKPQPDDDDACMDPRPVSPEPLMFLLPAGRRDYRFTWAGTDRIDGREAAKIDYRATTSERASVKWHGNCVSIDVPSQAGGRVWVDPGTGDVLRLDERLIGRFDLPVPAKQRVPNGPTWMEIVRADSTIRYKPVRFHDPDEMLLLPASIESLTIITNAGVPRLRTVQTFSNYRRFMTAGRLVK
ncbi:MAG: hypothetical protein ACM3SQ_03640 [Betaproteobacteria bacterium]